MAILLCTVVICLIIVIKKDPVSPMTDPTGESPVTGAQTSGQEAVPVITAPEEISVRAVTGGAWEQDDPQDLLALASAADETGKSYPVTLEGEYDLSKAGVYALSYVITDNHGSRIEKALRLTVLASPFAADGTLIDGEYITDNGHSLAIKGGLAYVDGYLLVNKSYSVPEGFSSTGDCTRSMVPEVMEAFQRMRNAAPASIRANITIRSGVRNIADQTVIFNNYVRNDGLENALTYSARPRYSEHHTGLAMDILTSSAEESKQPATAAVLDWLNKNAWKYGFIQRYPENKTEETGYIYEPWHYRYVGTELAEALYNNGDWITMETYFGVDSFYHTAYSS